MSPEPASGSVQFDRAAGYYDRSRALPAEVVAHQADVLMAELRGASRVLEIGIGTGRIALTLDVPLIGLALSRPMMEVLRSKGGTTPLVEGDATMLPFPDDSFDAGCAAHVLHLIPTWELALAELVRVVRPGGMVLVVRGSGRSDIGAELNARAGVGRGPVGADTIKEVDDAARALGLAVRSLPEISWTAPYDVGAEISSIEQAEWSGLWSSTHEELAAVAADLREWAVARFGASDAVVPRRSSFSWHVYDVPR